MPAVLPRFQNHPTVDVQNLQLPLVQAVVHIVWDSIREGARSDTQLAEPGPFHLQALLRLLTVLNRDPVWGCPG